MTDAETRITLRRLPLAAKLVLSVFLMAVGIGYSSALVQLHMKQSGKNGEALPTLDDVVERFSGLKKPDDCPPLSRVEALVSGNPDDPDVGQDNMAPAFFAKSKGWHEATNRRGAEPASLRAEREGERQALLAWVKAAGDEKKKTYEADRFPLPDEMRGKPITAEFADGNGVKIKTLLDTRCQACHKDQEPNLASFAELEPHVSVPSQELISGKWVRSTKQISVEALTQSTHAHLLSFAMLFTLTGLTFAFTSYPGIIRCIVAPVVLMAQVFDVACWWLARVPDYGPFFAQTIVFTGGVVGSFLGLQIVLSLLNMYGRVGKTVLVLLFVTAAVLFGVLGRMVIEPALRAEREAAAQPKDEGTQKTNGISTPVLPPVSKLERLIMGPVEAPLNSTEKGSMASAFFHKDGEDYKSLLKDRPKEEVDAERNGERKAIQAWIHADESARQAAYVADKFALPKELADKPLTPEFRHADQTVMVKSILNRRCVRCHMVDGSDNAADHPLENYEQIRKHLEVRK